MGTIGFNRWRLIFACSVLWLAVGISGRWSPLGWPDAALLSLSGLVGICVGDTALFACMNRLGPRRSGVLFACHALFSALLAWWFLGETLWGAALVLHLAVRALRYAPAQLNAPLQLTDLRNTFFSAAIAMGLGMTLILLALKHGQANLVGMFSSVSPVLLLPMLWVVYRAHPATGAWWGTAA
jgi:drug/metabolite transporter (DMT)-like permease